MPKCRYGSSLAATPLIFGGKKAENYRFAKAVPDIEFPDIDYVDWVFDRESGTLFVSGNGDMVDYCQEHIIDTPWYDQKDKIIHVFIEDGVTSVGGSSFFFCKELRSIEIPDSVTRIGSDVFNTCVNLKSIRIPYGVTELSGFIFFQCTSLTSIEIPDSVRSIGDHTFYSCSSLTSIEIPVSVNSIHETAFSFCENLTDIYYAGAKEQWNGIYDGYLSNCTIHCTDGDIVN